MNFHDQLIGSKLVTVTRRHSGGSPPPLLILEEGVTLATQYDDEGNPGDTEWQVTDRAGFMHRPVQVQDLRNQTVTGVGYFLDPLNGPRKVIPYVEFSEVFLVFCMTPHGGGVIHHHRPGNTSWDLFCQFTPNLTPSQKDPL
jgi:hypothetical protein